LLLLGLGSSAPADTLKLRDGTVLEGNILSEDETQVTIEVELASGSITKKQVVNKTEILRLVYLTAEEKAQRLMEMAFQRLLRYQLDPVGSQSLNQYDHVITDVFGRFLAQFPDSPHEADVRRQLSMWVAERNRVANGSVRFGNDWVCKNVRAALGEQDENNGLRLVYWEDGPTKPAVAAGRQSRAVQRLPKFPASADTFVYFVIDDYCKSSKLLVNATLAIEYFDAAPGQLRVQFDGEYPGTDFNGAYESAAELVKLSGDRTWKSATFQFKRARFRNSQNGGADFRLWVSAPEFYVANAALTIVAPSR
jgi:hypothetical protein